MSLAYHNHFIRLANYHRWAYIRLFQTLKTSENDKFVLTNEQYYGSSGLFFHSIHGTLVHLYLAELLWYCRLNPKESMYAIDPQVKSQENVSRMWNQNSDEAWTNFFTNLHHEGTKEIPISREDMEQKILQQCDRWIDYVSKQCHPDNLDQQFEYKNTKGVSFFKVRGDILDHIFNHGTHHRGQITAPLTAYHGRKLSPVLDLLYFYDENS